MFAAPIVPPIAPFPETVTEDRWHQPLSEPVRFKRALPVAQHPASFMVGAAPFLESVISYCTAEGGVMLMALEYANEFTRKGAMVELVLKGQFGQTDAQVDALFIAANAVTF
jgi:hypothetical protein